MGNNDNKWDRNQILTLIGVIIAAATLVASVLIPEMRNCFSLKDGNTPAPVSPASTPQLEPKPKPPVIHQAEQEPADPQEYTIGENKSEFAKEAKARLSVSFHDDTGEITAKITISPAGKDSIVLPTVGIGSQEFASSAGVFLVHVLNVDWNSRTVTVQVSRKL